MTRPSEVGPDLWDQIGGRLWHVTTPKGWNGILADGAIRHDLDDVPYPNGFCRRIDAVSLFDLSGPADEIDEAAKDWLDWLNGRDHGVSLWIEIDRDAVSNQTLGPVKLLDKWRELWLQPVPKIIAGVEAAHLGPVPLSAVIGVLLADGPRRWRRCPQIVDVEAKALIFAKERPPSTGIGARMEAARCRIERRDAD